MNNLVDSPLVTIILLFYKQEKYVKDAISGVLSQDYLNLEIIISDDCSPDRTFEEIQACVEEIGKGMQFKKLIVNKNENNLGLACHVNKVIEMSSGDLIVAAAGDDISLPDRVSKIVEHWKDNGRKSGSIFSGFKFLEESGEVRSVRHSDQVNTLALCDRREKEVKAIARGTTGCAHAWTRDLFEIFGPMDGRILHEDITLPLRSLLVGCVTYIPEELVVYRVTTNSLSRPSYLNYIGRFKKMANCWRGRVENYRQFDADVAVAERQIGLKQNDMAWLNNIVAEQRMLAEFNYKFFSGDAVSRIKTVFDFSLRVSILRRAKLMLLLIFPFLYGIRTRT